MGMMQPYAEIDEAGFPIVKVRVVSEPTDDNYQEYLASMTEILRRGHRVALFYDAGNVRGHSARYRELQAHWQEEISRELGEVWICAAFVIRSRVLRGVLAVFYWANPPYYPYTVVNDPEAGLRWIRRQLAEAGAA